MVLESRNTKRPSVSVVLFLLLLLLLPLGLCLHHSHSFKNSPHIAHPPSTSQNHTRAVQNCKKTVAQAVESNATLVIFQYLQISTEVETRRKSKQSTRTTLHSRFGLLRSKELVKALLDQNDLPRKFDLSKYPTVLHEAKEPGLPMQDMARYFSHICSIAKSCCYQKNTVNKLCPTDSVHPNI